MYNYRFNGVPLVQYNNTLVTDLTQNLTVSWTPGNVYFINYSIKDGDTAENISYRLWNDSSLSWILCLINNIIDPFFDWPLRSDEMLDYTKNKYGAANVYAVHHYEKDGYVVNYNPDDPSIKPITNYMYEFNKNEEKRKIVVPSDTFIQDFLNEWGNL